MTSTLRSPFLRLVVFALLAALGLAVLPLGSAHAATSTDVTWTVRTASNQFGEDRTGYEYALDPGASIEDGLMVTNRGPEELDLGVYAADGFTTETGQLDLLPAGEESAAVGAWTTTGSDRVVVPPGETVTVPFTVAVPDNATPGDYAGGIVTSLTGEADSGIGVDRRLGIRISLRVGGALTPAMTVDDVHVDWLGGLNPFSGADTTVTYALHNTGNAILRADQALNVAGPFGAFPVAADAVESSPELLPGESWTTTVTVPGIAPLLLLTATATITPVVVDASGSTTGMTPLVASGVGWAVPWVLVVLVLLVVAAAILLPIVLRRRRASGKAREDARVAAAVAQALAVSGEAPQTGSAQTSAESTEERKERV